MVISRKQQCACRSGDELLLLLRNSTHNNNTWGLPGGNVEDNDTDLLDTAKREAQEEMGALPSATFQNQILTKYVPVWHCNYACLVAHKLHVIARKLHVIAHKPHVIAHNPHICNGSSCLHQAAYTCRAGSTVHQAATNT